MLTIQQKPCAVQEPELTTAEQFFYDHAAWEYDPETQTLEEGRRQCARELAEAERDIRECPGFEGYLWKHAIGDGYLCELYVDGVVCNGLDMISDDSLAYRRVVEASLASEFLSWQPKL